MKFRKHDYVLSLLLSVAYYVVFGLYGVLSYIEYRTAWSNKVTSGMLQMLSRIFSEEYALLTYFIYPIIIALLVVLYFAIRRELYRVLTRAEFLLPVVGGVCGALGFLSPLFIYGIWGSYIAWFALSIWGLVRKEPPEEDTAAES